MPGITNRTSTSWSNTCGRWATTRGSTPLFAAARTGGTKSVNDLGSNDITQIFGDGDVGAAGANAANPGDFDLAVIFGDMLTAVASGGNFLTDILP